MVCDSVGSSGSFEIPRTGLNKLAMSVWSDPSSKFWSGLAQLVTQNDQLEDSDLNCTFLALTRAAWQSVSFQPVLGYVAVTRVSMESP